MQEQWKKLEAWLQHNDSKGFADLNPSAADLDIQKLEKNLGAKLPIDFTQSLKTHNGQQGNAGSLFSKGRYLRLDEILSEWSVWCDLLKQGEFDDRSSDPDQGIKQGWWNTGWIPFVSNGRGDHLCLDLDPAPGGCSGQVIEVSHDFESRSLVSSGFRQWFSSEVEIMCNE